MAGRALVSTEILEDPASHGLPEQFLSRLPAGGLLLEHAAVAFRNYPYEWAPEMLYSAAERTLAMGLAAMRAGFTLKDATPYNLMFDGGEPVFLDVLSFRRRNPTETIWHPNSQFIRTFILPLLACKYFGLRLDEILLAHRDGLEPERMWELCPAYRLLFPPFLASVTIPVLLGGREGDAGGARYRVRHARDAEEAAFILERLFARTRRLLERTSMQRRSSEALRYMECGVSYDAKELAKKESFLAASFERWSPKAVLDVGCNTGHFSLLAAKSGARVVAIDYAADAAGWLWQSASAAGSRILPLVVDIGRPPGACGWQNGECAGFLERARGTFDCVLMLALMHHLLVNERVPMPAILQLAAELTTHLAMVEYIDPADLLFQRLARGRDGLHQNVSREAFEAAASCWFQILDFSDVSPTRRVYVLRKWES